MRWGHRAGQAPRPSPADPPAPGFATTLLLPPIRCPATRIGSMKRSKAEIVREYGPFPGVDNVAGVTYDGRQVWFGAGDKVIAFDPASGKTLRAIEVAAHAGTAFDGKHLYQIAEDRIQKIDSETGRVLATIPAPGAGADS